MSKSNTSAKGSKSGRSKTHPAHTRYVLEGRRDKNRARNLRRQVAKTERKARRHRRIRTRVDWQACNLLLEAPWAGLTTPERVRISEMARSRGVLP